MHEEASNDPDRETQHNIDRFGCSVVHVMAEGDQPPFSYSVGIEATSGAPELVVIGLKQEISHFIVNAYNRRVREGEVFEAGKRYQGFLEGFDVEMRSVDATFHEEYFGYNIWYYSGSNFRVTQLVYPNKHGVWPWEPEAGTWFKSWQPILAADSP